MNETTQNSLADEAPGSLTGPATNPCPPTPAALSPLPGESTRAFEAFCAYLELGPRRRLSIVAAKIGVSLRTLQRWALQFNWRQRLNTQTARAAEQFVQTRSDEQDDAVARESSLRKRQIVLAEAVLDVTERYFERVDDMDLEFVRLPDVCRALESAARLVGQHQKSDSTPTPDHGFRDHLAALLDQAFRETQKPASTP